MEKYVDHGNVPDRREDSALRRRREPIPEIEGVEIHQVIENSGNVYTFTTDISGEVTSISVEGSSTFSDTLPKLPDKRIL